MVILAWADGERDGRRQKQGGRVQTFLYSASKPAAGSPPATPRSALPLPGTEPPARPCPLLLPLVLPVHRLQHFACSYCALGVTSPHQTDRWARIYSRLSVLGNMIFTGRYTLNVP